MNKFIITGGGTGGHLAVASAFIERLDNCIYIGSTHGLDRSWCEQNHKELKTYFLPARGFVGLGFIKKILALLTLAICVLRAVFIILKERPSGVISVGGYSSLPTCLAAKLLCKPVFLHEQNSRMGLANKITSRFAKKIFCAYVNKQNEQANIAKNVQNLSQLGLAQFLNPTTNRPNNETFCAEYAPYPLRKDFLHNARAINGIKTVLIVGGSQGANALNKLALDLAPFLASRGIKLLHQCGIKNYDECLLAYENTELCVQARQKLDSRISLQDQTDVELIGFCSNMPALYELADFAISRAGASACAELCAKGVPTLFVPYEHAANNHQFYNALSISSQGLALLMNENQLDIPTIKLILDSNAASIINQALLARPNNDGAAEILKSCNDFFA